MWILEYIFDSLSDIWSAAQEGRDSRNQEIVMKLLPVLLVAFVAVILGIIWILEGGSLR